MRSKSNQHGTLDEAYRCTETLVTLGQRRMSNDDPGLAEVNRLAEGLGEQAAKRVAALAPDALMELTENLRYCMDYRFQIAEDMTDVEEALHIAMAFVAWTNGFGITGTQLALAMQMVECSLEHVLPRTGAAAQGATLATQCRQLVEYVHETAGSVERYRTWCATQFERLRPY